MIWQHFPHLIISCWVSFLEPWFCYWFLVTSASLNTPLTMSFWYHNLWFWFHHAWMIWQHFPPFFPVECPSWNHFCSLILWHVHLGTVIPLSYFPLIFPSSAWPSWYCYFWFLFTSEFLGIKRNPPKNSGQSDCFNYWLHVTQESEADKIHKSRLDIDKIYHHTRYFVLFIYTRHQLTTKTPEGYD